MSLLSSSTLRFVGAVIAGGKSSRMGANKALMVVGGVPLWQRQYDVLGLAGAERRVVSLARGSVWLPSGADVVVDAESDAGPLSGLAAVLDWAGTQAGGGATHVLVAAVDLPKLGAGWFQTLAAMCSPGMGAVGRSELDGYFEPLAAIYPREMAQDARDALAAGRYSLQHLVLQAVNAGSLAVKGIGVGEAEFFLNWNSPGDVGETKG